MMPTSFNRDARIWKVDAGLYGRAIKMESGKTSVLGLTFIILFAETPDLVLGGFDERVPICQIGFKHVQML